MNEKLDKELDKILDGFDGNLKLSEIGWEAYGEFKQEAKQQLKQLVIRERIDERGGILISVDSNETYNANRYRIKELEAQLSQGGE